MSEPTDGGNIVPDEWIRALGGFCPPLPLPEFTPVKRSRRWRFRRWRRDAWWRCRDEIACRIAPWYRED